VNLLNRLRAWLSRERLDRELDDEIRAHLELAERDARAAGLSPEQARLAARRSFGGVEGIKEEYRDERGVPWLENLLRDIRHGLRGMRRAPGLCAGIILILGAGIGANTTMFSATQGILLRPLAYGNPDDLVVVMHRGINPVSFANFADWREQSRSFAAMGAAEYWRPNLGLADGAERILGLRVTDDLLPLLQVPPLHGRFFNSTASGGDSERSAVISYGLWQRVYGGVANVVGQTVRLDGENYTIVGVMPREFAFAPFWAVGAELWAPLPASGRTQSRGSNSLRVFGRLAPGTSVARAQEEIDAITSRLDALFPGTNREVTVVPLKERVVGDTRLALLVLMAGVAFVLLIACANVAHLLLARTAARQREVAVRAAIGATPGQILRQFLVESVLFAVVSGLAGLGLAAGGVRLLTAVAPSGLPRVDEIRIDAAAIGFTTAASVITAVLFGLAPAFQAARAALGDRLRSGRGITSDQQQGRLRDLLIASEIALALVLLAGAGLMVRSMSALRAIDPGFDPRGVLSLQVSVHGTAHAAPERRSAFFLELLERMRALPAVRSASAINHLPIDGDLWTRGFRIEGRSLSRPGEGPGAYYRVVLPGYFETMGLRLVRGRDFSGQDTEEAPPVAILSEGLARRQWPDEDAIGKRIALGSSAQPRWMTVVGLVENALAGGWTAPPGDEMYLPYLQTTAYLAQPESRYTYLTVVLETSGDPAHLTAMARSAVAALDPGASVANITTMEAVVDRALARPRFELTLLGLFAGVALLLAAAGIYAMMSYAVSRRTQEIGLRLTLGAQQRDVLRTILRQATIRIAIGAIAGLTGAVLLTRLMSRLLYAVQPGDPVAFVGATAFLITVALLASFVPAWRASRLDPVKALRQE
jgi:putative ABC transport system permease protein